MTDINVNLPSLPDGAKKYIEQIFGPAAELGEMLSEKIRFYRWRSSLDTMNRARVIADERGFDVNEIPFRKLVPLLEKSSLEEESSPLIDRWAELLALASHDEKKVSISFIDILSRIDSNSVGFLDQIVRDEDIAEVLEGCGGDSSLGFSGQLDAFLAARISWLEEDVRRESLVYPEPRDTDLDGFRAFFQNLFYKKANDQNLVPVPEVLIAHVERGDVVWNSYCSNFHTETSVIDSLQSVGLVDRLAAYYTHDRFRVKFISVMPTSLGFKFVMACRGRGIEFL